MMAYADYHHCAVCDDKAFYDANITDPRYVATYDADERKEWEPIAIKVLCFQCAKTHEVIVRKRRETPHE